MPLYKKKLTQCSVHKYSVKLNQKYPLNASSQKYLLNAPQKQTNSFNSPKQKILDKYLYPKTRTQFPSEPKKNHSMPLNIKNTYWTPLRKKNLLNASSQQYLLKALQKKKFSLYTPKQKILTKCI